MDRDQYAQDWLNKARHARGLDVWPAWSHGELLAVALILRDERRLAEMGNTRDEALERLRYDLRLPGVASAGAWFDALTAELDASVPVPRSDRVEGAVIADPIAALRARITQLLEAQQAMGARHHDACERYQGAAEVVQALGWPDAANSVLRRLNRTADRRFRAHTRLNDAAGEAIAAYRAATAAR